MININNQKMSKSLGNVLWAKDLLEQLGCNVYKWLMLSTHYRNPLNFTDDVLNNVKKEVAKVDNVVKTVSLYLQVNHIANENYNKAAVDGMVGALEDDLNTSNAITLIYDLLKSDVDNGTKYTLIKSWDKVLSLNLCEEKEISESLKKYIEEKIEERKKAKEEKNYALADQIREELLKQNIILKDTREKTTYEIK